MSNDRAADLGGFHPVYCMELLASRPIDIDEKGFAVDLAAAIGPVTAGTGELFRHYFLNEILIRFKDRVVPGQIMILTGQRGPPSWDVSQSLQQSWHLPAAEERVAACQESVLLSDFMSSTLDHRVRRRALSAALCAVIDNSNIELVHFVPTMQFLDANDVLERLSNQEERANPTCGFLNVRLFRISNVPGEVVMDSLGLSALGLSDVQIHFRDLDPNEVAGFLYGIGRYLFEKGDVIEADHTVEGLSPGERWRCRRERSLVPPERVVIDIDPGPGASGRRRDG